ncbi:hypothetical protein T05_14053 [Trichinella murrelli]|uniref:Uncharacterized protein n=1 Tax=Trichinella murrelli TaxID=144512 RepID=A0A0V0U6T0_9BILA|nr:hypothetical protein T05_14053 [Trichinella murrelli]
MSVGLAKYQIRHNVKPAICETFSQSWLADAFFSLFSLLVMLTASYCYSQGEKKQMLTFNKCSPYPISWS